MKFVAIDFETANEKRYSPCSLGITVIENNKILEEKYWLIRPKELRFESMNIMIHGIRPKDVENEKEFDILWPEILPYLTNHLVIAHNASFDMSVLRNTLDLYKIPYPELTYACTMVMSKQFYSFLDNAKLDTVNRHLGYQFDHHHASADATACANILLAILDELDTDSIEELSQRLRISLGSLYPGGYKPCKKAGASITSRRAHKPAVNTRNIACDPSLLLGKVVAITGPLKLMSRYDAIDLIYSLGGSYSSTVTKKTNMVITNVANPDSLDLEQMSSKLRKAMLLREKGQSIDIVTEDIFLS